METHYHSQFDNDGFYDERVYRLHHELFALLLLVLDETAVVPLKFARVAERVLSGIDKCREVLEREEITAALKGRKEELVRELERAESIYRGKVEKYGRSMHRFAGQTVPTGNCYMEISRRRQKNFTGKAESRKRSCWHVFWRNRIPLCGLTGMEMCFIPMR